MPYIPKGHEKYDLLPYCHKDGGEVFEYPGGLINEAEKLMDSPCALMPYNYESYDEYFNMIDSLIKEHSSNAQLVEKLKEVREMVYKMNQKEEWSILKYLGPTDDACFGLTHGKNYYWPSRKENPVYCGVIDDEEFTAYLYPTEAKLWEILEDPTGMAYRTIYGKGKGYMSAVEHENIMLQLKNSFEKED